MKMRLNVTIDFLVKLFFSLVIAAPFFLLIGCTTERMNQKTQTLLSEAGSIQKKIDLAEHNSDNNNTKLEQTQNEILTIQKEINQNSRTLEELQATAKELDLQVGLYQEQVDRFIQNVGGTSDNQEALTGTAKADDCIRKVQANSDNVLTTLFELGKLFLPALLPFPTSYLGVAIKFAEIIDAPMAIRQMLSAISFIKKATKTIEIINNGYSHHQPTC